jgi:outer membrane lipoprotein-sorting protein
MSFCGRTVRLFVVLLVGVIGATAQEVPAPRDASVAPEDRLGVLVERIRIESSRRSTMEADFMQRKTSAFLQEPLESVGVFSYRAPDKARWEYQSPDPITLVIHGEEMLTWYRDLGRAERIEVGRVSQRVLDYLSASSSIGTLLEYFTVFLHTPKDPAEPYRLELVPRYKRIEKRLKLLELWIEPQQYLLVRMRYVEADNDVTEYQFDNFRVNEEIPAERFEIELPPDVVVESRELGQRRSDGE